MPARERSGPRIIEFELNLFSLALAGAILIGLLAAAFLLGRAAAGRDEAPVAVGVSSPEPSAPGRGAGRNVEELGSGTVFDDDGADGSKRAPEYQVTREASRGGRYTLELGRTSTRASAETLREAAVSSGVGAAIVSDGAGGFIVTGGPFRTRAEAENAGVRLGRLLGRQVPVQESDPRP